MAIKIKNPDTGSAHDQAAASIETDIGKTVTKTGEDTPVSQDHQTVSEPVTLSTPMIERIDVGMSFKMPVASYTMLEFTVRRSVPYEALSSDPDAIFDSVKKWVEDKLNALIEEQQPQE